MTRFLAAIVFLFGLTGFGAQVTRQIADETGPADLVLLNGRIYTLDAARPWSRRSPFAAAASRPLERPRRSSPSLARKP
jgi:hypothetical protein